RQFLGQMPRPRVEHIHGLSPSIAIEQKSVGTTPRSTVGTVTEIYDYLRILYARLGTPYCPDCHLPVRTQTTDEVIDRVCSMPAGTRLLLLAPQEVTVGQKYDALWQKLRDQGFLRVRIDGETCRLDDIPEMDRRRRHTVEVVVDRVTIKGDENRSRVADSVEAALELGSGMLRVATVDPERPEAAWATERYSLHFACSQCGRGFEELTPHQFSFNSPLGWCEDCEGLGVGQGTSTDFLIADKRRSLREGAISAWPDPATTPQFERMLEAISSELNLPLDVPMQELSREQLRLIAGGTGDRWFTLRRADADGPSSATPKKRTRRKKSATADPDVEFQFQYKGLLPAMEEAARVSYAHRQKLQDLTGEVACPSCGGSRLKDVASAVRFRGKTIAELCDLPLSDSCELLQSVRLDAREKRIAGDLLEEATSRLSFLVEVGLTYLSLSRTLPSLSGGEMQRIRLAGQIGRALTGVLYVLDEPTIGLHPRDNARLLGALHRLRDLGNTLILVEHDREVIDASDRLYDFGPGAGRLGGTVVSEGTPKQLARR
ncbi:MAG: excinuclease ABC subunit A, partial [Planctomycetaceae bacterium]|nr:excinuclease ABC subunit A [Planctomycetaceae bacterium]